MKATLRIVTLVVGLLVVASVPARAELITLDFNVFPGTFRDVGPWPSEDTLGAAYASVHGIDIPGGASLTDSFFARLFADAMGASYARNGSGILIVRPEGLTLTSLSPFTLLSVEVLPHFPVEWSGYPVRFTGRRNGAVTGEFDAAVHERAGWHTLSGESLGVVDTLLLSGFNTGPFPQEFWIDNLTIHRAPEPSALLALIVGGLVWRRRRHAMS